MDKLNKQVLDKLAAEKAKAEEFSLDVNEIYSAVVKTAQQTQNVLDTSHQDKLVNTLVQKMTSSSAADGEELAELKKAVKKLDDDKLIELLEMCETECEARGLDEEEVEEHEKEEKVEEEDVDDMMSYVMSSLKSLANEAANEGNIEAAYMIERTIQKLS
jgi:hypothetical protein